MAKKKLATKKLRSGATATKKPAPGKKKKKVVPKQESSSEPTTTGKKKKKKKSVSTEESTSGNSVPKKKKKTAPPEGSLASEAARAKERLKQPTRKAEDGYGPDDLPDRREQRPAEYEKRADPRRAPRRMSLRGIWENRFYTMLCSVTNRRCSAHCELEALRDNFRGDKVKHYRKLVALWLQIYHESCQHEHSLMAIVTEEFPNFRPPPMVLNWPHVVSKPPEGLEHAMEQIDGDEYIDGKWASSVSGANT